MEVLCCIPFVFKNVPNSADEIHYPLLATAGDYAYRIFSPGFL